jgi:hypothetical protein
VLEELHEDAVVRTRLGLVAIGEDCACSAHHPKSSCAHELKGVQLKYMHVASDRRSVLVELKMTCALAYRDKHGRQSRGGNIGDLQLCPDVFLEALLEFQLSLADRVVYPSMSVGVGHAFNLDGLAGWCGSESVSVRAST